VSKPGLCIVAQGAKRVMLGQTAYEYDSSSMVAYAAEVPIAANVTRASPAEPYLCLVIDLDQQRIAELALKVFPHGLPKAQSAKAIYIEESDIKIVNAAIRLVELLSQPGEADLLAPLLIDEILIRLLRSPAGAQIAQIGLADSNMHKISKAISWLRDNYAEPMKIEALADMAHMSESSFHQHFKTVTSMSPLQFQKVLRLQEARNLMLSKMMDVSSASLQVGYASVSQFSREYSRFFGNAPTKDIVTLRSMPASGQAAVAEV
jgi:AraC-like DNA-binding protein